MQAIVSAHLKAEGLGDIDGTVAVYTDDIEHDAVGFPGSPRHGKAAAREFYEHLTANLRAEKEEVLHRYVTGDAMVLEQLMTAIALPLPESLRAVALLGWLAVHGGSRTRSEIASSLWPDVPDAARRRVDVADSPLRFPEWWTGIESTTVGGDGDYTCTSRAIPTSRYPRLSMHRVTTAA
jgi:hypothetical protein